MIVTVTPNPSVDRTVTVPAMRRGEVLRATSARIDPGGKGVNVARALVGNGTPSRAVIPLGGSEGRLLADLLAATGVEVREVTLAAPTRANISIVEPDGTTTKINEPGPQINRAERAALVIATLAALDAPTNRSGPIASALVISGSLPPGLDPDFYAELVHAARGRSIPVAVDTTGASLLAAVAAGADLIKPNEEELAEAVGRPLTSLAEIVDAAQSLRPPHGQVLVSLGARGALLVDDAGAVLASAQCDAPLSTVGAGDALLAGYLHAATRDARALATGVGWGTAAVGLPGSQMPTPREVARVTVTVTEPVGSGLLEQ